MSFDIALSGIQAINQQLGTISNNIANAGTYGFKSSRANFASLHAGAQPTGVHIGSTTQSIGQNGGIQATNRGLDALINGRGFFVTKDLTGQTNYTRVGIFTKDATDFLVNSAGQRVQGFALTPPSLVAGPMGDITVPTKLLGAKSTANMDFVANMSADWTVPTTPFTPADAGTVPPTIPDPASYNMSKVTVVHDSLGNEHTVTQYFVRDSDPANPRGVLVYVAADGTDLTGAVAATLVFDTNGQLDEANNPAGANTPYIASIDLSVPPATTPQTIKVDYTGTTFQKGESTTSTNSADGYAAGSYVGVELDQQGNVVAKYSNGEKQAIARVTLATFPNEDALTPVNETSWQANVQSGSPNYSEPGKGVAGALTVASLETSNVDITAELVGLMTAQRNYQANSKVITAENQMLQSLMQAL
ncbi:flagellar hook-basal body complex protein [Pseudoduganella sp. DS3]|uniref:Flagellar hook protein FlgE n=1 Tax=Pseudoduganella guangdongensis TaxID=2692179 RepID=A0A6N9HJQ3_9BURK|nr:flagellar hook-basal body complex protein [Pseudoduganella guangdongensis]MYN03393.1 flagellar hook-basal body complex protein [Pseudoduganella guangdongensis]